jgi:hypothetical protein
VRKIKKLFSRNTLVLVLAFLGGGIVENQLRVWSALTDSLDELIRLFAFQVSIFWALAFAVAGAFLMLVASRIPRGQRAAATPRNSRLASRVGKQQRSD